MISRRQFSLLFSTLLASKTFSLAQSNSVIMRKIPSSNEVIPIIGMGTSRTFDIKKDTNLADLLNVLEAFFDGGGHVIDSSPMSIGT